MFYRCQGHRAQCLGCQNDSQCGGPICSGYCFPSSSCVISGQSWQRCFRTGHCKAHRSPRNLSFFKRFSVNNICYIKLTSVCIARMLGYDQLGWLYLSRIIKLICYELLNWHVSFGLAHLKDSNEYNLYLHSLFAKVVINKF